MGRRVNVRATNKLFTFNRTKWLLSEFCGGCAMEVGGFRQSF